jgi:hypothetical protein
MVDAQEAEREVIQFIHAHKSFYGDNAAQKKPLASPTTQINKKLPPKLSKEQKSKSQEKGGESLDKKPSLFNRLFK